MESGKGNDIARKCLEEMKKRAIRGRVMSKWEEERKEFF